MINRSVRIDQKKQVVFSRILTVLVIMSSILTSGQQVDVLFGTPVAIYGRWIAVGMLVFICILGIFSSRFPIAIPVQLGILMIYWITWSISVGIFHNVPFSIIFEWRVAKFIVLLAGIGLVALLYSQRRALILLNKSFLIVNILLVVLSVILFPTGVFSLSVISSARFQGIFRNPNYLSYAAANTFILLFFYWHTDSRRDASPSRRILLILCTSVTLIVLLATKTRSAWIGVGIAITVYYMISGFRRLVIVFGGVTLVFLLLSTYSETMSESMYDFIRLEPTYDGTVDLNQLTSGRYSIFQRSLDELREHPERLVIGTGERELVNLGSRVRRANWHDPIALLHSEGVIGYMAYYVFAVYLIFLVYRAARKEFRQDGKQSVWGYQLALMLVVRMIVSSLSDSNLIIGHLDYLYYWLFAGIMILDIGLDKLPRRMRMGNGLEYSSSKLWDINLDKNEYE